MFILLFVRDLVNQVYKLIKAQLPLFVFCFIFIFVSVETLIFFIQNFISIIIYTFNTIITLVHNIFYILVHNVLISVTLFVYSFVLYILNYLLIVFLEIIYIYLFVLEFLFYISDVYLYNDLFDSNKVNMLNKLFLTEFIEDFKLSIFLYNLSPEIIIYYIFNLIDLISFAVISFITFLFWFSQFLLSLEFLRPILKGIVYLYVYCYSIVEMLYWYISNIIKLFVIIFFQFITFLIRLIAPLDHGGSQYRPFPEFHFLLGNIKKVYYYPDIYTNFFMFINKTFKEPLNIFVIVENFYNNFFTMFTFESLHNKIKFILTLLVELDQLSWYNFVLYTVGSHISYVYLYINLSHLFVYLILIGLFMSWFVFKGWMDIQLERVNTIGFIEIIINFIRSSLFVIFKYRYYIYFVVIVFISLIWFIFLLNN